MFSIVSLFVMKRVVLHSVISEITLSWRVNLILMMFIFTVQIPNWHQSSPLILDNKSKMKIITFTYDLIHFLPIMTIKIWTSNVVVFFNFLTHCLNYLKSFIQSCLRRKKEKNQKADRLTKRIKSNLKRSTHYNHASNR